MRKTLSIILCAAMLLSLVIVGVSAASTGTAINSAADFAAMTADGSYYLNADITINETYPNEFFGTFDGNGKTIQTTVPLFKIFSGNVSNLTIRGDITSANNAGALAIQSNGMIAIGVDNYANVKVSATEVDTDTKEGTKAAGFVATDDRTEEWSGKTKLVFRNCRNFGNITVETAVVENVDTGAHYETFAGGFVGRASGFDAMACENHGEIKGLGNIVKVGGFAGRLTYKATGDMEINTVSVIDCINKGVIESKYDAGGFVGYLGCSNNTVGAYKFHYNLNEGEIRGGYRCGGFIGYCYSTGSNAGEFFEVFYSINNADVYGGTDAARVGTAFVSQFVGYSNSTSNTLQYSIGNGKVAGNVSPDPVNLPYSNIILCINGCSSAKTPQCVYNDNYLCDDNTTVWYTWATDEKNAAQRIELAVAIADGKVTRATPAEIQDGTVKTKLNTVLGKEIFVQGASDAIPQFNTTLRAERLAADPVIKGENVNVRIEPEVTEDPSLTTEEPTNPPKPRETTAPNNNATTPAAVTTAATANNNDTPKDTTANKPEEKGCGGLTLALSLMAIIATAGAFIVIKKK